jgi:hypothetical protein
MKTTLVITSVILFEVFAASADVAVDSLELPKANVNIRVVDENQKPVKGADVSLYFDDKLVNGVTDLNGVFTGEGQCNIAGIGSKITKAGYYLGSAPIPRFSQVNSTLNQWEPWGGTYDVVLRPVINPIPLFVKKVDTIIPVLDKPCGYDLEVGDWVEPYGKGFTADFVFNIHKSVKDVRNFDAQGYLAFSNPMDGLQSALPLDIAKNSIFKWERLSPENGYEQSFHLQNTWLSASKAKPIKSFKTNTEWDGYFFRVRSIAQDGNIVSAHYGKIAGGIEIYPRQTATCSIRFTFYYNPTPLDRNLEWDPSHDLFGQLNRKSIPREP